MCMGHVATAACLLAMMLVSHSSTSLPWIFPGDFRERLRISDLVVSRTIEDTSALGVQNVDHTELAGNVAHLRIGRVFRGSRKISEAIKCPDGTKDASACSGLAIVA